MPGADHFGIAPSNGKSWPWRKRASATSIADAESKSAKYEGLSDIFTVLGMVGWHG
jgi:hypothetical protein